MTQSPEMTQAPQTYSSSHIRRQRDAHVKSDGYGRHRHLYLHESIRRLAFDLRRTRPGTALTWLDYGCGKGGFIEQIRPLALFDTITGYDPAVKAYGSRPVGCYDLVTCLDVLDITEHDFRSALIEDIAALTGGVAVFDILTRPRTGTLRPHPAFHWSYLIGQHMAVTDTKVEFPGMDGYERAVIVAARRERLQP